MVAAVVLFVAAAVVSPLARAQGKSTSGDRGQNAIPSAPLNSPQDFIVPSPESLIVLIRSSLLALSHANETGNYTVLRDLAAPAFQAINNAAKLSIIFADLRERGVDLLPVAYLTPQLTSGPTISQQGLLSLAGTFPTQPASITFQVTFQVVDRHWRLFGIAVNTTPAVVQTPPRIEAPVQKPAPKSPSTKP
jgi:hypothetical protein